MEDLKINLKRINTMMMRNGKRKVFFVLYKIENIEIKIHYNEKNKNIVSIHFVNLEIEIEKELFVLNSKNRFLTYDLKESKIFEKNKTFSFVNGKEYLVNAVSLFVSKNKVLLEKEIRYKIKENKTKNKIEIEIETETENQNENETETDVLEIETEELIKELIKFNTERLGKIHSNLIDIALDENDMGMFEELVKEKSKFTKG